MCIVPPPVQPSGFSFLQILFMILICCVVQAVLLKVPFDKVPDYVVKKAATFLELM